MRASDDFQLLTIKQTAALLSCSPANVYGLIETGSLPVVQVGRAKGYRIDPRDLDGFVQERKFKFRAASAPLPRTPLKHLRR